MKVKLFSVKFESKTANNKELFIGPAYTIDSNYKYSSIKSKLNWKRLNSFAQYNTKSFILWSNIMKYLIRNRG